MPPAGHALAGLTCRGTTADIFQSAPPVVIARHRTSSEAARTLICAALHAASVAEAEQQIAQAAEDGADVLELRLDLLGAGFDAQTDPQRLIAASKVPVIVACRTQAEGGEWTGHEAERLSVLRLAAKQGATYIDVNAKAAEALTTGVQKLPKGVKVIVSHHFEAGNMPDDAALQKSVRSLQGGDIARIVATASDISDSLRMLDLLKDASGQKPLIPLCLGERGLPSRVLAAKYGAFLTYGGLREGVPGEPSVRQLVNKYRLKTQTPHTKVFGVVGTNVAADLSYIVHNAANEALGEDAVYLPFRTDDFHRFLKAFSAPDFAGFSVTMPFKCLALAAADIKDPVAQRIGASNTLISQPDGRLKASNTDYVGVTMALQQIYGSPLDLSGRSVCIVGTGGAGQAIAFAAAEAGAEKVLVADVATEKAEALAASLGSRVSVASLDDINAGKVPVDILANATPIGMYPKPDAMAVTAAAIDLAPVVFDAIYTPPLTKLLQVAKQKRKRTVSGLDMFVGQAAYQYQLLTGRQEDVTETMRVASLQPL